MSMYDMHSYSYPGDGIAGIGSSAGWGYQSRAGPLHGSMGHSIDTSSPPRAKTAQHSPDRQGSFLGSVFKLFNRHNSRKALPDEENNNGERNRENDAGKEDIPPNEAADHVFALSLLFEDFSEATNLIENSVNDNSSNGLDGSNSSVIVEACPFMSELGDHSEADDSVTTESETPQEESVEEEEEEEEELSAEFLQVRKIKFADEEGLPIEEIIEYEPVELEEDEEEETSLELKLNNLKKPKGYSRARRRLLGEQSCRLTSYNKPENTYKRYYKSYNDEYESKRIQAAGAFSMVGF